jgi:hypothetical protein
MHGTIWQVCLGWPKIPIGKQGQAQQLLDFVHWLVLSHMQV